MRDLKTACEKDDAYLPARVNLASAHIMAENYSAAKAIIDEALALNQDDAGEQNNHAVALYLLGPAINVDMFQQAADILKDTIAKNKQFAASYYNLGRIMAERERNAAAKKNWEKYIQVEPAGMHAAMARTTLGTEKATTPPRSEPEPPFVEPSPVKLGDYDTQTEKQLAGLVKHSLALGPLSVEYHTGQGMRVLVMEWVVEFAECPVKQKYSVAELKAAYGSPLKMFDSPSGVKTWVYEKFAVDVKGEAVTTVVHFEKDFLP